MKVFFYSHTLRPGGAEKQCALIAAEIKKRYGYESAVILNWDDGAKPEFLRYLTDAQAELIVLPRNPVLRLLALFSLFRAHRDAVLFNYLTYPDFVGGLVARLAGLRRVVGGFETDRMFGPKMVAERIAQRFLSARTIVNSHKAFDFCASRGFDRRRMVVMPSAVELSPRPAAARAAAPGVRIICTGRFVPEKDYLSWVDVIADVYAKCEGIEPVIIGYGALEGEIRAHIAEKGLADVIRILPGQTADVREELGKSDVYLSTSIQEGTSNTILEAMDASLPIVTTDVGDNARMVEDGASGYVCRPKDVGQLSASLLKLVEDPGLRTRFGARAREIVEAKYSLGKIAADYDELIRGLR